jgi:hypothetical protein
MGASAAAFPQLSAGSPLPNIHGLICAFATTEAEPLTVRGRYLVAGQVSSTDKGWAVCFLADASSRIVAATEIVAARFVVVDAIDDNAAHFYSHYGYQPIPDTRRLVRKLSDLAHGLGNS